MNIRAELEKQLGVEAIAAAWDYMVDEGHVATVESGKRDLSWLADRARSFLVHAGKSWLISGRPVQMLTEDQRKRVLQRHEVLSILWAKGAEAQAGVAAFRKEILRGRLLKWEDVGTWLDKQAKADGPGGPEAPGSQTQVLAYSLPFDAWERCLPTTAGGVLDWLRQISEWLSKRYRWQEAQATTFVLTGQTPLVPPAEAMINRESIILTIDPSLTPRQVADYYRRFKKSILGGGRIKALQPKHLRLAAFDAEQPSEESWPRKMEAWNGSVPKEWRYTNDAYFRRDCLAARRRLMEPLPPPAVRYQRYLESQQRAEQEQGKINVHKKREEKGTWRK